jgi:transposase-like protein
MQKRDRKRYSREFKVEAVRRTQVTGKSVAEVARELEIPVHHLYKTRHWDIKAQLNISLIAFLKLKS